MKLTIGGFSLFLVSGILFLAVSVSSAQSSREFYISNDPSGIDSSSRQFLTLAEAQSQSSACLLYTSPSPRDATLSRMPSSA